MKNVWLLLKVQLSALLGFNKILHLKDKGERTRKLIGRIAILACMLIAMPSIGMYAYVVASGMRAMGLLSLFPAVMLAASCMLTLVASISMAHGTLFAFRDYDMVMSLPVSLTEIASSRILLGYVVNLMSDLMIAVPCGVVYAMLARPAASFYPIYVLLMLAAPAVPMVVGAAIGVLVARLTARFRGTKYLQMLLSTAFALGIMSVSWNMEGWMESGVFSNFGTMLAGLMNRVYPLTGLYTAAVADLDWGAAALFVLIAVVVLAAVSYLLGRVIRPVNTALTTTKTRGKFHMRRLKTSSQLAALYKKELRRYLSSVSYLFNTAFGLLFALLGVGYLMISGRTAFQTLLEGMQLVGVDNRLIAMAIGYIATFMVITCCTTSCSISMEGKSLWLIQSLPVSGGQVLVSKLLVNLTLTVPVSLVTGLGAGWALKLGAEGTLLILMMSLSYALLNGCLGLMINLKSHNFEWTTETAVVKQSAAVGITLFVSMALIAVPAVLTFIFIDYALLTCCLAAAAATAGACVMLALFRAKGDRWIQTL